MELEKQHPSPDPQQVAPRIGATGHDPRAGGGPFQLAQGLFQAAVVPLGPRLGGQGALVAFQVKLAAPGGKRLGVLRPTREKLGDRFLGNRRQAGKVLEPAQRFEMLGAGSAAAVADPEQHQRAIRDIDIKVVPLDLDQCARHGRTVVVVLGQHVGQHARPVDPLPVKRVIRETVDQAPRKFHRHEIFEPRQFHQLRQGTAVAEHIRQRQIFHPRPKLLLEKPFAVQQLAHEGFAAGDVGI